MALVVLQTSPVLPSQDEEQLAQVIHNQDEEARVAPVLLLPNQADEDCRLAPPTLSTVVFACVLLQLLALIVMAKGERHGSYLTSLRNRSGAPTEIFFPQVFWCSCFCPALRLSLGACGSAAKRRKICTEPIQIWNSKLRLDQVKYFRSQPNGPAEKWHFSRLSPGPSKLLDIGIRLSTQMSHSWPSSIGLMELCRPWSAPIGIASSGRQIIRSLSGNASFGCVPSQTWQIAVQRFKTWPFSKWSLLWLPGTPACTCGATSHGMEFSATSYFGCMSRDVDFPNMWRRVPVLHRHVWVGPCLALLLVCQACTMFVAGLFQECFTTYFSGVYFCLQTFLT